MDITEECRYCKGKGRWPAPLRPGEDYLEAYSDRYRPIVTCDHCGGSGKLHVHYPVPAWEGLLSIAFLISIPVLLMLLDWYITGGDTVRRFFEDWFRGPR